MTPVRNFDPPANVDDFNDRLRRIWHKEMNGWFEDFISEIELGDTYIGRPGVGVGKSQFYNPSKSSPVDELAVPIVWTGFPRTLLTLYDRPMAFQIAEHLATFGKPDGMTPAGVGHGTTTPFLDPDGVDLKLKFRLQDEYLEWRTVLDPSTGKIMRVTFTCEGPEYWSTLARYDRPKLLQLYRQYVDPSIEWSDLAFATDAANDRESYQAGDYNPRNKWNTTHGIMHLSHWANTLTAEIELAGAGTVLRPGIGTPYLSESARLICCSAYGGPNRSSDPQIGSNVNKLAQQGAYISLQIPVGLYIDQYDENCITDVDGQPVPNFWRVLRGDQGTPGCANRPSRILRLEYEVPEEFDYVVGDLFIDGEPIKFGGQLAAHVHMKLTGLFHGIGTAEGQALPCLRRAWRLKNNPDFLDSFIYPPPSLNGTGSDYEPAFQDDAAFLQHVSPGCPSVTNVADSITHIAGPRLRHSRNRMTRRWR